MMYKKGLYLFLALHLTKNYQYPHPTQCIEEKITFGENKGYIKNKEITIQKENCFRIFHQRLGHISTISLLAGDTANVWEDIQLMIYQDHFYTSCQIFFMNKKYRSKNPLNPKVPFKWVFMDIIPSTAPKSLTSETTVLITF